MRDTLRDLGVTAPSWLSLLAVIGFFNGSNVIASGLMVEYEPPVCAEAAC